MIYAKSNPIESLGEHTGKLLDNYEILKDSYGHILMDKIMWKLLKIAVEYHDTGKIYSQFQNSIIRNINRYRGKNIKEIDSDFEINIPHNYLSPAFLPYKNWGFDKKICKVLYQAIAYHHERKEEPDSKIIAEIIEKELCNKIKDIKNELDIEVDDRVVSLYTNKIKRKYRIKKDDEYYNLFVLVKGLLHRLDHSSSAHEKVELAVDKNVGTFTSKYLKRFPVLREVQKFSKDNKDRNLIVVASTGMGKTESALLWIDEDKGFFTLPLRVSINALYDRITKEDEIGYGFAGLLHSTSINHLEDSKCEESEMIYEQSRLLSKKLTFCTIDQIFKFPFKYLGYEKSYATLAYSKVVIDEIQAYDPKIAATLLVGLKMINDIGGKFMIMTATLPPIYEDYLKKVVDEKEIVYGKFLTDTVRHKIKIKEKTIIDDADEILTRGRNRKVLVIVNTVSRAIEVFEQLDNNKHGVKINLLHSMFIKKDRAYLERKIKEFADDEGENGIWVTTQLVEASLDIDFDYLFTELSPLDSFFQRLGRCYRKRQFNLDEPNVFVYTEEVKGIGSIYDKDIWDKSKKILQNYDLRELKEEDKIKMINKLYSRENLDGSEYLEKFDNALNYIENINPYELNKNEAQDLLRNIDNVNVIPRRIYENIEKKIDEYKSYQIDKNDADSIKYFKKLRRDIDNCTVSIPYYVAKKSDVISPISERKRLSDLYILERKYDFKDGKGKGVLIGEMLSNIL
ncbi:CRISPR-associated helicase Cas3' [Iocasia frigidifontis]|uniref:CRISPR-associated helicase Cas3 n=1 Tax=Iocasia fonsfrigidae TaxID=2682810 RepID=A0A8A7KBG8_9FIRM|nr:CRISPR-associated helicase Cas3' [Iocasia fonsfrigidae]QTL99146.1 CRISPR-associated helicase Cas3' [Iocasia fonsfrigidae]